MKLWIYISIITFFASCSLQNKKEQKTTTQKEYSYPLKITQFISPNGDSINDCWVIPELIKYPKNVVKLFNRWGNLVYEKEGYTDEFCGIPNTENGIKLAEKDKMLPEGTYYYIIDLKVSAFEPYTGYMQIRK